MISTGCRRTPISMWLYSKKTCETKRAPALYVHSGTSDKVVKSFISFQHHSDIEVVMERIEGHYSLLIWRVGQIKVLFGA